MGLFWPDTAGALTRPVTVEIAPLFGTAPSVRASFLIEFERRDGRTMALIVRVRESETLPRRTDCSSLLAGWLFLARDPSCTIRTLALAVLCGWFRGALGLRPCAEEKDKKPDEGRAYLAWVICWLAWRMLFGIDIAKEDTPKVEKCLEQLFAEWCESFHYKGPRCECNQHGIILGCIQVSPKGRILCFDEWKHRRYVLTGPLISHWGAQLGLAPLDVVATRLASWICCVARARMPDISVDQFSAEGMVLPFAGGAMGFGRSLSSGEDVRGVSIADAHEVSVSEFVRRTFEMIVSRDETPLATAPALDAVSARGLGLHLLEPHRGLERAELARPELAELSARMRDVPVMARKPIMDLTAAFAESVAISEVKARETLRFDAVADALRSAGVVTLADLTRLDPETAVERVRPALAGDPNFAEPAAVEKAVALVYDTSLKALAGVAEVVAEDAKGRDEDEPFTRADLLQGGVLSDVRRAANAHLRGRGKSMTELRRIAASAVAARR